VFFIHNKTNLLQTQDFRKAFGLGEDDKNINRINMDDVALAAIQELYEIVKEKNARIAELEVRLAALEFLILNQKENKE